MFTGLRVLELASVLAGPSVGQFFAELGADVIKIENPSAGGDVTRTWRVQGENTDDRSAYFCCCNWGKRSVLLDLSAPEDKKRVVELASRADLVIASYKPGDAEKLGVDYQKLKKQNPRLIYGQITGYGADDNRVGYDAVIQAEAGFMDLNGEEGGAPTKMPVALIDVLAAHQLKEALLLALLKRERTGAGEFVEVSLIQTAVSSLANQATNWLVAGKIPGRQGSTHPNIAPYGESFITRDGKRLLLAIGNDKQFQELCGLLGAQELKIDVRFSTNSKRVENRTALNKFIAEKVEQLEARQLLKEINSRKIPAGLIQNIKEVFEMPAARPLLMRGNQLTGVRSFVADISGKRDMLLPPPHLGEHSKEVFEKEGGW